MDCPAVLVTPTEPPRPISIVPVVLPAKTPLLVPVEGLTPVAAITWTLSPAPVLMVIAPEPLLALRPAEEFPCTVVVVPAPSRMSAVPVPLAKAPTPRLWKPLLAPVSLTAIVPPVPKVTAALSSVPSPLATAPRAWAAPLPLSVMVNVSLLPARMVAVLPVPEVSA